MLVDDGPATPVVEEDAAVDRPVRACIPGFEVAVEVLGLEVDVEVLEVVLAGADDDGPDVDFADGLVLDLLGAEGGMVSCFSH